MRIWWGVKDRQGRDMSGLSSKRIQERTANTDRKGKARRHAKACQQVQPVLLYFGWHSHSLTITGAQLLPTLPEGP
jgi:hypothetical protein